MDPITATLDTITSAATTSSLNKHMPGGRPILICGLSFSGDKGGADGVKLMGVTGGGTAQEVVAEVTDLTSEMQFDVQTLGAYTKLYLEVTGTPDGSTAIVPHLIAW